MVKVKNSVKERTKAWYKVRLPCKIIKTQLLFTKILLMHAYLYVYIIKIYCIKRCKNEKRNIENNTQSQKYRKLYFYRGASPILLDLRKLETFCGS